MGSNGASGGGGNTGREKGAERNRNQATPSKSKSTNTNTGNNREDARSREQVARNLVDSGTNPVTAMMYAGMGGNGGGADTLIKIAKLDPTVAKMAAGPTTAEVSQVTSEEARASANELIKKRRRGRGRSLSMLQTSSQGLDNKGLTLGKPTLLG